MTRLSRRRCCARLATLLCGFAAARCATVSPQEERQIGRKQAEELERTVGLVREQRIVEYVEAIGARLVRAAGRSDIAWQWSVADEPNAFALPGGYVYRAKSISTPSAPSRPFLAPPFPGHHAPPPHTPPPAGAAGIAHTSLRTR